MSKLLIVVDAQNDFISGVLGSKEAQAAIPYIATKLEEYQNEIVVFTQDTHYEDYLETQEGKYLPVPHCLRGFSRSTKGWEICHELMEIVKNHSYKLSGIIEKSTFGVYDFPKFLNDRTLDDPDSIELVGFCTDICVISNALILKAFFPEIPIKVYAPACAGTTVEKHKAALEVMKSCQIEVYDEISMYMNQPE